MVCKMATKLNISKCKYIHYGKKHAFGGYNINGQPLTSVDYHKDLGVTFNCYLNFHQQTSEVALKANRVLACMKRAFIDLNCDVFLKLYKALVRPIMEYANIIWGPHFLLDKRKLERVQRRATKLIPQLRWRSNDPPTQLVVFTNSAETKPFTQLNYRYSVNSSGSW